jgi:hypothetical protein
MNSKIEGKIRIERRWLSSQIFCEKICVEGRIERGLITNLLAHISVQFRSKNRVEQG